MGPILARFLPYGGSTTSDERDVRISQCMTVPHTLDLIL